MTEKDLSKISYGLTSLCVFRKLLEKEPLKTLKSFLCCDGGIEEKLDAYGSFAYSLRSWDYCFSDFLKSAVLEDGNRYMVLSAKKEKIPDALKANAEAELKLFSLLTCIDAEVLCPFAEDVCRVPRFENKKTDMEKLYRDRLENIERYGYGVFSRAHMFRIEKGAIVPVKAADDITLGSFVGYDEERRKVFDNTAALVENRAAANILLYGDAGTGKSSTVKACANHFCSLGVRLIEFRKDQLTSLPYVMDKISGNPLKFIIFIDDLSFSKNDDSFSMLKAALEGSASAKAKNAVIYATSNRRHIIRESFSDRAMSDDVHFNDTVQELMSLSARFGMTVYFQKPDKALYLDIVHELARRSGVEMTVKELDVKAEAFALARGSRSPRAAGQFVQSLL